MNTNFSGVDAQIAEEIHRLDQDILYKLQHFRDKYIGKKVRLTKGWRKREKGSLAVIDSVIFHESRVLFLCMVINRAGERVNGDAYTREFRPFTDFELI